MIPTSPADALFCPRVNRTFPMWMCLVLETIKSYPVEFGIDVAVFVAAVACVLIGEAARRRRREVEIERRQVQDRLCRDGA